MEHFTVNMMVPQTNVTIPMHAIELPHVFPQTFSFVFNFHNIKSSFSNNVLTLNSVGPVTVTIPDGCYTQETLNTYILGPAASDLKYYAIQVATSGDHWDIIRYNSSSDRTNLLNGTTMSASLLIAANQAAGYITNADLFTGVLFYDRIYIRSEIFHVHQNDPSTLYSQSLITSNDILVPVTVDPMQLQQFTFLGRTCYENKQNTSVTFTLVDVKGRIIVPLSYDYKTSKLYTNPAQLSIRIQEYTHIA